MKQPPYVGVIGSGSCPQETCLLAEKVGFEIGARGWVLVCGGLGGVMEGAAKGCRQGGGLTLGILPGMNKETANSHIEIPIPTGLGDGRNLLVVRCSDVLVAVSGGFGTLSEIALALKAGRPVIGLDTWEDIPGVHYAEDHLDAIKAVEKLVRS